MKKIVSLSWTTRDRT